MIYPKKKTALAIKEMLERSGLTVSRICAGASSALEIAQQGLCGVIVCPFVMSDMTAAQLAQEAPRGFDVVALSRDGTSQYMGNLITLPLPADREDFINTVRTLALSAREAQECGDDIILRAKKALCRLRGMSEPQAHKYLQRLSMESGKKLASAAAEVLDSLA